jgi:hypothetical protein
LVVNLSAQDMKQIKISFIFLFILIALFSSSCTPPAYHMWRAQESLYPTNQAAHIIEVQRSMGLDKEPEKKEILMSREYGSFSIVSNNRNRF